VKLWEAGCAFCPLGKNPSEGEEPALAKAQFSTDWLQITERSHLLGEAILLAHAR